VYAGKYMFTKFGSYTLLCLALLISNAVFSLEIRNLHLIYLSKGCKTFDSLADVIAYNLYSCVS